MHMSALRRYYNGTMVRDHIQAGEHLKWIAASMLTSCDLYTNRSLNRSTYRTLHIPPHTAEGIAAIVNVGQDVDEPWELHLLDPQGRRHRITMEPGDMVYYESASAVHGREIPLNGSWYANCFIHYAPTKDSPIDWSYEYKY